MSRNQKLAKLGNAIRAYRGVFNTTTNKWRRPPQPNLAGRVLHWLEQLQVDEPIVALADIQEFKSFDEMHTWLKRLSAT